jgi:hypothetical protein
MPWKGHLTTVGIAKASAWGTPVAVGAGHQVYIISESLTPDAQFIPQNSLTGTPFQPAGDKGNEFHAGDLVMEADYDTLHRMLAFAMGTAGSPAQPTTDLAYIHTLRWAGSLEGIFTTLVIGSSGEFVREYTTCKHNGFSLSIENGQRLQATFPVIPHGLNINTTSGTNELTSLPNIALPTGADTARPIFNHLRCYITDFDAADFDKTTGSADEVYVSSVSLGVPGAFPTDDVTTQFAPFSDEPIRDNWVIPTGVLNFSKLTSSTRIAEMLSKAKKKMLWQFIGPVANGVTTYDLSVFFSDVQFSGGSFNVGGPQRVPETINFQASVPTAAHTGFSFADAIYMTITNQQSTDPLA